MPRLCEPCRHHSADDALTACPECGGPVKFTLLPPPNATTPAAMDLGDDAPPPPRTPFGFADLFRGKLLWVSVAVLALLPVAAVGVWAVRGETFSERVAKVKPGMTMTEVMRVMGDSNKPKHKRKVGFTVGPGGVNGYDVRTTDTSTVTDVWDEDGVVAYAEGFEGVRIEYSRNTVTGVERISPDRTTGKWRSYN